MSARSAAACAIALLIASTTMTPHADAATYRVDDTGSLPSESTALLQWQQAAPSRVADDRLEGTIGVSVRLNLEPWVGQTGRLYLVLPEQGVPSVRVSWRTQGRLLPGEILPGQRVLVFQGSVPTPILYETLLLRIEASADQLPGMRSLDFHFEIDTD